MATKKTTRKPAPTPSIPAIARKLGVTPQDVRDFMRRHGASGAGKRRKP